MKSKQLTIVLLKVLGVSVCLYAIPSCVSGIMVGFTQPATHTSSWDIAAMRIVTYSVGAGVQFLCGLAIIGMSRTIAGWLFKSDDE